MEHAEISRLKSVKYFTKIGTALCSLARLHLTNLYRPCLALLKNNPISISVARSTLGCHQTKAIREALEKEFKLRNMLIV